MAVVLDTRLKMDGKVYEEGSDAKSLPAKARKFAKDNGLLKTVVDPEELEVLDEDEDEEPEAEAKEEESEDE